jgi:hypothetical protein
MKGWHRAWLGALSLAMGFAWPGASERLVGELTRAATPRDKRDALRLLGSLESSPREPVLPFLSDPDPGVRAEAERLLSTSPEPAATATRVLVERLDDESLEVRIEAARALAGRPDATLALSAHAEAPLPELRAAVVDALAHGAVSPELERVLARALLDRDREVVLAALRGYARHPALTPADVVRGLAQGVEPQLASAARMLAAGRTWDDPPWLRALEARDVDALEATLPEGEQRATEPLLAWLAQAPALAARLVALLVRTGGRVEASQLEVNTLSLPLLVRARSARSLDVLEAQLEQAGDGALALARDPARVARLAAHYTRAALPVLAAAPTLPADPALERILRRALHEDAATAALALRALGTMGIAVLEALDDPSPGIVIAALRGSVHDRSPAARLKRAALHHATLGQVAASALTASVLAGDPLDVRWLAQQRHAAWPLGRVAEWALQTSSLSDKAPPWVANERYLATKSHAAPRTLRLANGLTTISWPDASGRVDWPSLRAVDDASAWPPDGERK